MTHPQFAADAQLLIDYKERARRHGATERFPDADGVMATIVRPELLTWQRTLCWAFNSMGPDGLPKIEVYTTPEAVRACYHDLVTREQLGTAQSPVTDIRSNWYAFGETLGTQLHNRETGEIRTLDSIVVSLFDGGELISAEICWFRSADVALEPREAGQRWTEFLSALRAQDVPALLALMAPSVQGAVRDYIDAAPPFVAIDGIDAMRAYYEKLFAHVEVAEISLVRVAVRGWYVFAELKWKVRLRTGPDAGRELAFLTAEHMAFDADGLFHSRCGYGTEMETAAG